MASSELQEALLEEESPEEADSQKQDQWAKNLGQIRKRVEEDYGQFPEGHFDISLHLMYGKNVAAVASELDVSESTVDRVQRSARHEALTAVFGKHHLIVAFPTTKL